MEMSKTLLNLIDIEELSLEVDGFLNVKDHNALESLSELLLATDHTFESIFVEANYLYVLGNIFQEIFSYSNQEWFSDNLSRSVIFFRRALYVIRKIERPTDESIYLKSCIETNLGNTLSSQGRAFCCIPFWNNAIEQAGNPVAVISKANNSLFISHSVYDPGHSAYHYFTAYKLINYGLENPEGLYPEQTVAYAEESNFIKFKEWFENTYDIESFKMISDFKTPVNSRKEQSYLNWCGKNNLFINDLTDEDCSEISYQDILSLPSFSCSINPALTMSEELAYHGNFDELKNDYCYGRYLFFSAKNIPSDQPHFFNNTYPHVDDMCHTITNLKASQYKSAFRTLYSLFDKIAHFINRFFDLNDLKYDHRISFDSIFKELKDSKQWQPHPKLKESKNHFLHALFYILKDLRDVKDSTSISKWLDPDAKAFSEIRNALEHRSLKIVDDFGHTLNTSHDTYRIPEIKKLLKEAEALESSLKLAAASNNKGSDPSDGRHNSMQDKLNKTLSRIREQKKLESHSLIITESEFETRLMSLMTLARNSIMYLSLAIHLDEKTKPKTGLTMSREIPLK